MAIPTERWLALLTILPFGLARVGAQESPSVTEPRRVIVEGRLNDLVGEAASSSEGVVGAAELAQRPLSRPAEIVESIPGVIISQHSGGGKANQYYLRGFNLDHGTDLASNLDGMPINNPSHGHGQGYTDLNLLIPELVREVDYQKGPYFADVGDFGSAGSFNIRYYDKLPAGLGLVTGGSLGYARALFAASPQVGTGTLLAALEYEHSDGPWVHADDYQKFSGVLRYSRGDDLNGFSVMLLGYHGSFHSTDQIPRRAIGPLISRFGEIDATDGGDSTRLSLIADWRRGDAASATKVTFFASYYDLNLFSNFTYFLNHPDRGDQFEQKDNRIVLGFKASQTWFHELFGRKSETAVGLQARFDDIRNGLFRTEARVRFETTREDRILETSAALHFQNKTQWLPKFRSIFGLRADLFHFDVRSDFEANSGRRTATLVSPKIALIFGPWAKTELYLNAGFGMHSNDARGVVGRFDPTTGENVGRSAPLVRTKGAEAGLRTTLLPGLQSTLTFWGLDIDSELVFSGDAGTTEPSRPSRRYGVELANIYEPAKWLTFNADVSYSRAKFRTQAPEGQFIPGSVKLVAAAGVSVHDIAGGLFASLRYRYFGPRALIENNSARSPKTSIFNAQVGYKFNRTWTASVDGLNLFNERSSDIDYFYVSRLRGESADGVADYHTHPNEPRNVRVTLTAKF